MPGVLAYHLVLTTYGFWLPNDPRGSWSAFVRAFELYAAAGPATKNKLRGGARRSVAARAHNAADRRAAKSKLARPPVIWTGRQARAVAQGFADYATPNHHPVHALAVMPDHAHLVVGRTDTPIEKLADQFKARATTFLNKENLHPFSGPAEAAPSTRPPKRLPTPWARHQWAVYLNTPAAIHRAIQYVNQNPTRAGHKPQHYKWITPYAPPTP